MKKMLILAVMLFAGVSAWGQWTGPYKLSLPKNNFRIATERFSESGQLEAANVYAMIGDTYCYVEAHPGENTLYEKYDYTTKQGLQGTYFTNKFVYDIDDPGDWFDMYAPAPEPETLWVCSELSDFGRDNQNDPDLEPGIVMQRLRQYNRKQTELAKYYKGEEDVCGVRCWVFDFRGKGVMGYGSSCWWIDPSNGLVLKRVDEDGSRWQVTDYQLDYKLWDKETNPYNFYK